MKPPRALLVEFHNHHDEVLPSVCHLLRTLGYEVTLMTTAQNLKKDAFCYLPDSRPHRTRVLGTVRRFILHLGWGRWVVRGFDLVVYNSIEPARMLRLIQKIRARPALGVLHNGILIKADSRYRALLDQPGFVLLSLEAFVAERYLGTPRRALFPYRFASRSLPRAEARLFCVQGTFDYNRRNYETLLTALREFKTRGGPAPLVRFIGNVRPNDFEHFVSRCQEAGVEAMVEFLRGGHGYQAYLAQIAECTFLLPLIESGNSAVRPYFDSTASSSVTMGVGLGVIPVIHDELARCYDLEEVSVRYGSRSLYEAMVEALTLPPPRLIALRQSLADHRDRRLALAVDNVRDAITQASSTERAHV